LFDNDGSLHIVHPHYHLVEWNGEEVRYHPVLLSDLTADSAAHRLNH
jgi:hypothetical protein